MNSPTPAQAEHQQTIDAILSFWFLDEATGRMDLPQPKRWFKGGKGLDKKITEQFSTLIEHARQGHLQDWTKTAHGALALIVLLDQFSRHRYRGTAKAFSADPQALELCHHTLRQGFPAQLTLTQQVFCYLPLEHDESIASQEQAIALFESLCASAPDELQTYAQGTLASARQHKHIIDQFGRYPYRNAVLNRVSTAAEKQWLARQSVRFGQ